MGFGNIQGFTRHPDQEMNVTLQAMQEVGKDTASEVASEQKTAMASAQNENAEKAPPARTKKPTKTVKARSTTVTKMLKAKGEKKLLPVKQLERKAQEHSQKNPELKAPVLEALRKRLKPGASSREVQDLVGEFYRDPLLANDAMEFLLDTTDGELNKQVQLAHEDHVDKRGREIVAGRSINKEVQKAFDKGLGEKIDLRKEYWQMISQPKDFQQLFSELSGESQSAKRKFFFHAVGDHLKDPSLTSLDRKPEMMVLMNFKSNLQAVGSVQKFFKNQMQLVEKESARQEIELPKTLTPEAMSKAFVSYIGERYASPQKLDGIAKQLRIDGNVPAMILIFTQFQTAIGQGTVGQMPPRVYQSDQHKKELGDTVTAKLEDLEDQVQSIREQEMEMEGEDYLDVEIENEPPTETRKAQSQEGADVSPLFRPGFGNAIPITQETKAHLQSQKNTLESLLGELIKEHGSKIPEGDITLATTVSHNGFERPVMDNIGGLKKNIDSYLKGEQSLDDKSLAKIDALMEALKTNQLEVIYKEQSPSDNSPQKLTILSAKSGHGSKTIAEFFGDQTEVDEKEFSDKFKQFIFSLQASKAQESLKSQEERKDIGNRSTFNPADKRSPQEGLKEALKKENIERLKEAKQASVHEEDRKEHRREMENTTENLREVE